MDPRAQRRRDRATTSSRAPPPRTSAWPAARQALADGRGVATREVDLVVFATMTPDHYFPGVGRRCSRRSSALRDVPCFDIRQQCVGFLYGLQLVDAHIRAGPGPHRPPRGRRDPHRLHAVLRRQLGVPLRPLGRAAHARGTRLEHALPPPHGALRRRRGGGGGAGGGGRGRGVIDHDPAHRRHRLRQALRARHGLQAPALHRPRPVRARRPHPGHGRPLRLQDGHHAHGRGGARASWSATA